jgi:hypothetical protein
MYAAIRFDRVLPHGGLRSMKSGWVTSYLESVILASWISITSVVVAVPFRSSLMTVELRLDTPYSNGDPPPAFATTSTETIDFSIGFGFAALIYVSLEIFREF